MHLNKRELSEVLDCSLPTVDALLRRHGDAFPVVERGRNGREWQFDPDAVVAFLREVEEQRRRAGAAKDDLVSQYRLPLANEEEEGLKPSDLLNLARLRKLEREEAVETGFLVQTSEVRQALMTAFARLNRAMHAAVRQACRDHNVPEAVARSIDARVSEAQRAFVRDCGAYLEDAAGGAAEDQDGQLALV